MADSERKRMLRELRQRLESLGRAGVDRIPAPTPSARPGPTSAGRPSPPPPSVKRREPDDPVPTARPSPVVAMPATATVTTTSSLFGDEGFSTPPLPEADRAEALAALGARVAVCELCPHLAASRTQTVFGDGSPTARLMFVGEAPGADEDRTGVPFVGRAGQLLNDMIVKGMGLRREDVYIANILKSRPPGNRDPLPDEVAHCLPYLERQVEIIRPSFLCLLGRIAAQTMLQTSVPIGRLRGRWYRYKGIPTLVTFHPSYLLRTPSAKKDAWDDLKMLMREMGLRPPTRKADGSGS